jgi:TolB-like protein
MATVYLARDLRHDRSVALKVLHPELAAVLGPERFLREIQLAARLQHPHILSVHDSGEAAGQLWYTMPWVEGGSLRQRLARERQLPVEDALQIARQVASALAYAHEHGIIHRDIKPENILLEGGEAVVADFGIAKALSAAGGERLTETGLALGTPAYMSPEQAAGARDLDGRTDQYSLGCVLYEMLVGEPPFTGPTGQAVIARRFAETPTRARIRRETVPEAADYALARALARVPADRFGTIAQFANALTSGAPPAAVQRKRSRRTPALALGAAVLLAIAAMLARRVTSGGVIASAAVIAVVPFRPSTGDTGLARLGRDLVVTISQTLDGIGGIRTVDAQTILAQEEDERAYSRDAALALGQHLGAGSVLHGSLVRIGPRVRADLGLFASDTAAPLARVSLSAPADSIASLTDSIVRTVLRQIWEGEDAPSPSLDVALQTGSVEALRAFLAAEQLAARNLWEQAAEAYARTIRADSTFWLAYWRLAYAKGWHGEPVDPAIAAVIQAHRLELPDRERLTSESIVRRQDSLSRSFALLREVTRRFPDYWFGWLVYADELVHNGPLVGLRREEARAAMDRTLALNPRLIPMWEHFMWLALLDGDTAAASQGFAALQKLDAEENIATSAGWDEMLSFRLVDALLRGDSLRVDSLWGLEVYDLARRRDPSYGADVLQRHGFPDHQVRLSQQILKAGVPAGAETKHQEVITRTLMVRGAWDSALVLLQGPWAEVVPAVGPRALYRYAVVAAWLGALDPARAARLRPDPARAAVIGDATARADLAWLDGVLAAARRDGAGIAAARERAGQSGATHSAALERSLAALAQGLAGDTRKAGRALAALEWERADGMLTADVDHPFLVVINRIAAGRWLLEAGDATEANRLLQWVDGGYAIYPGSSESQHVACLLSYDRGRIAEQLRDTAEATRHYRDFLRRYDLPPPAHRTNVEQARRWLSARP